jgi:vancomycin permeability regulator SanA
VIRIFCRLFTSSVVAIILFLLIGSLVISLAGLDDTRHSADLAVVLGNMVLPDGTPSKILKARLDHTVDLYQQGYFKLILVSGGHGKEGYDEPVVMRHYLEAKGIPHGAILEDNDGYNTWKTAQSSARILHERNLQSVLVISQYFHMPRCWLAFSKFGIKPIYMSHAPLESLRDLYPDALPREVVGYVVYYFRSANQTTASAITK